MVDLVYQCYIGDISNKWIHYSSQSAESYADRTGSEYIFRRYMTLKGSNVSRKLDRYFNILDLIYDPEFEKFDNILYLDTDILVNPMAGNIFDQVVPGVDVVAASEYSYKPNEYSENEEVFKKHGSYLVPSKMKDIPYRFVNTGVIVFTKKGRMRARSEWDVDWKDFRDSSNKGILVADQPYINAMLNKHNFDVLELDEEWNYSIDNPNDPVIDRIIEAAGKGHKVNFYHCHFESLEDFKNFSKKMKIGDLHLI